MHLKAGFAVTAISLVCALLAGCTTSRGAAPAPQAQLSSPTVVCQGQIRAFGEEQTVATSLTCGGIEKPYVAQADNIAHRFSPCAYSFEAAGGGQMSCSNGTSGPLTYDMTDAANIKVVATLNDGRQMAFTLRAQ